MIVCAAVAIAIRWFNHSIACSLFGFLWALPTLPCIGMVPLTQPRATCN
jgi:hypothetical protein